MKTKRDVEQEVVDQVIAQLEAGGAPWRKSWTSTGGYCLRENGVPYRGFNQFILSMMGRTNPYWFTYNKAMELAGGEQLPSGKWVFDPSIGVRKGEKGKAVCFWGVGKDRRDDDKAFRFLKWYVVFNAEQIDGLPERFFPQPAAPVAPVIRDARVDEYVAETKANIRHGGASAYYIPSQDFIQSPPPEDFDDMAAYYGTLLHELGHWTGHADRLDRFTPSGVGGAAQEELVAEMSASFLSAHLGIEPTVREDHAQYIASWIAHLQDDKTALRKACAAAQRVVDFLDGLQPKEEEKAA